MGTDLIERANPRYLLGISDEPKQILQPITGYANEPLLSLEDACKPLINIVPSLKAYIRIAKKNTEVLADGLTHDESAAIRLYTMEWDTDDDTKPSRSLYIHLNRTLKEIDRIKLRPWFRYLKLLITALVKLPSAPRQTVWRGVRKDISADYSPGTESTWWTFSSCTTSLNVLESSLYLGNTGTRTLFSIEIFNGRKIRAHSQFVTEEEILLLPGTYFEVKSRLNPAPNLHMIHLQQKRPAYDLLELPFEGAELFPSATKHYSKQSSLDIEMNDRSCYWYEEKILYFSAISIALTILLIILLGTILGSRNTNKKSSLTSTSDLFNNYNISSYSPVSVSTAFYPFDGNIFDLYRKRDGTISGGPVNYIDGFVGYGQAIVLNQTNPTSISIENSFNLKNTDFTFELFIYFFKSNMNAGLLQFSSGMQLNLVSGYLQMVLNQNYILYTRKLLTIDEWHHIAVVYDLKQSLTTLYIDGILINKLEYVLLTMTPSDENVTMIIGSGYEGVIDQLSISLQTKTSQQILWDATVTAFFPLEGQTDDCGPNNFNATAAGIQTVSGKVHKAVSFSVLGAYIQIPGFTVLNTSQHALTIAFWIRPSLNAGIFLTIANSISCLLVLGLRSSDRHIVAYLPNSTNTNTETSLIGPEILISRWTHIALTWSHDNQAQLYQNTLWQSSNRNTTKLNNGYANPMTITLGMYHGNTVCPVGKELDSTKQFTGSLDEFYVFSKELKQNDLKTFYEKAN